MISTIKITLLAVFFSALFCAPSFAAGAGAYRVEMADARALSMGGAFVGVADSPVAVLYNPAGMTQIDKPQVSVAFALIQPKARAYPEGGGKTKMQQDSFLLPSAFFVTKITEKIALGVGGTSSWGLGTEWAQDAFTRYAATRTSLQNQDYIITGAYQVDEKLSIGAGITIDYSTLEKQKKINQFLTTDANSKLKGDSTAAGFQVSALYKLNDRHQFGVQYTSAIHRKYEGKLYLDGLNNAVLSAVLGYDPGFTGSSYQTDVVAKSTLPQSIDLGYSFKATEKLTLNADVLWMDWSSTKNEDVGYPSETNANTAQFLNTGNPSNCDWHSAWSLGLGAEYNPQDRLRLRMGYYFHQTPVPQDTWNPNMPDANSHSIATGFGYDITKSLTFDLAYSAMFFDTRSIKNSVGDSVSGSIDGKYKQWTNLVLATMTYKF